MTTLRYTRRPGPIYTGHVCRLLPSAVPWISEDRLLRSSTNGNTVAVAKKDRGKGMEGGKKVSLRRSFLADQKVASS